MGDPNEDGPDYRGSRVPEAPELVIGDVLYVHVAKTDERYKVAERVIEALRKHGYEVVRRP